MNNNKVLRRYIYILTLIGVYKLTQTIYRHTTTMYIISNIIIFTGIISVIYWVITKVTDKTTKNLKDETRKIRYIRILSVVSFVIIATITANVQYSIVKENNSYDLDRCVIYDEVGNLIYESRYLGSCPDVKFNEVSELEHIYEIEETIEKHISTDDDNYSINARTIVQIDITYNIDKSIVHIDYLDSEYYHKNFTTSNQYIYKSFAREVSIQYNDNEVIITTSEALYSDENELLDTELLEHYNFNENEFDTSIMTSLISEVSIDPSNEEYNITIFHEESESSPIIISEGVINFDVLESQLDINYDYETTLLDNTTERNRNVKLTSDEYIVFNDTGGQQSEMTFKGGDPLNIVTKLYVKDSNPNNESEWIHKFKYYGELPKKDNLILEHNNALIKVYFEDDYIVTRWYKYNNSRSTSIFSGLPDVIESDDVYFFEEINTGRYYAFDFKQYLMRYPTQEEIYYQYHPIFLPFKTLYLS